MANRFLDPNDSDSGAVTVVRALVDDEPVDRIRDPAGRMIEIDPGLAKRPEPNRHTIRGKGAGGEDLTWTVEWGETQVNRTYSRSKTDRTRRVGQSRPRTTNTVDSDGNIFGNLRMVTRIVLPSQLGGLDYVFTYNGAESNPSNAGLCAPFAGAGGAAHGQDALGGDGDLQLRAGL